ncbi:MAG TPA: type VI secretion system tube protein Hcp [Fimbriimonadaceae bacterium]|nr:type VI secretion system tube protein Hcp [Fimbriimonadaceae bacterium]
MKLGDIKGEATDPRHRDWMDIFSYQFGEGHEPSKSGRTSPPSISELVVSKPTEKGSPTIFLACAQGKSLPSVDIQLIKASDGKPLATITMKNVYITSYQTSADAGSGQPVETLSLNFERIDYRVDFDLGFEETFWDKSTNSGGGGQ